MTKYLDVTSPRPPRPPIDYVIGAAVVTVAGIIVSKIVLAVVGAQ